MLPLLLALLPGASSSAVQVPAPPAWAVPKYHFRSQGGSQGDPTAPVKLGSKWHVFVDGCGGWCHGVSADGAVSWSEAAPFVHNGSGIGTGSWGVLPNGTALGLYVQDLSLSLSLSLPLPLPLSLSLSLSLSLFLCCMYTVAEQLLRELLPGADLHWGADLGR